MLQVNVTMTIMLTCPYIAQTRIVFKAEAFVRDIEEVSDTNALTCGDKKNESRQDASHYVISLTPVRSVVSTS